MKRSYFLALVLLLAICSTTKTEAGESKPVFLYSRYFNAPGEDRYSPEGNYKEVLDLLRKDFEVRVNDKPLDKENLKGVVVVLVANPSDKAVAGHPAPHHVDEKDIREITRFVQGGGGFIVMANQENHNLDIADMNKLIGRFGIQFTNLYTDAKKLVLPADVPIIGGLRWAYYTGNLLLLDKSNRAKPQAVVTNDLKQRPEKGPRDQAGVLMATASPGKGHVVVVTDSGWLCDWAFHDIGVGGVALKGQDNWEIFHRLALWSAGGANKAQD
jgi:hypothetical protein